MPISASALEFDQHLRMLVMGPQKIGKALANGEPVLTPSGFVPIESLKVGDFVIGSDGGPTRVTGVFPQGSKPLCRFIADDGAYVVCSEDHLWVTTTLKELRRGMYYSPRTSKDRSAPRRKIPTGRVGKGSVKTAAEIRKTLDASHFLPQLSKPVRFSQADKLPLDPYFLGLMLGDGSLLRKLSFTKPDEELLMAVTAYAEALGDKTARDVDTDRCPTVRINGGLQGAVQSRLTSLGLFNLRSPEKFIPGPYRTAPSADRLALLEGLCDTDGYVCDSGLQAEFSTASDRLRDDVVFIVRSLGGRAFVRSKIVEGETYWSVMISFADGTCPFRLKRKALRWKAKRDNALRQRVAAVEAAGEGDCTCISVEAEDQLFVTRDFLLTHNTTHVVATAPGPVRVLNCESDTALRGAQRETKNFDFERVAGWDSMMAAVVAAKKDAKAGAIKTVVVDPLSTFGDRLMAECVTATRTKEGNEDGRKAHPEFTKRIVHLVDLLMTIPAHVIVITHYMETGGDDESKKLGSGLVPLMPNTASRTKIGAMFYDIVWVDIAKPGWPEYRGRTFITSPDGAWGPGCRSLNGYDKLPAHIGEFIKAVKEGAVGKAKVETKPKANGVALVKPAGRAIAVGSPGVRR
jgi:AAA domain